MRKQETTGSPYAIVDKLVCALDFTVPFDIISNDVENEPNGKQLQHSTTVFRPWSPGSLQEKTYVY